MMSHSQDRGGPWAGCQTASRWKMAAAPALEGFTKKLAQPQLALPNQPRPAAGYFNAAARDRFIHAG